MSISVGLTFYCTFAQSSDTFQLLFGQFLLVTSLTKAVGQEQSGLLPAGSHLPRDAFSRTRLLSERGSTSGVSVSDWESLVLRESRMHLRKKKASQGGCHVLPEGDGGLR